VRKITILVAGPPALSQIIRYLFASHPDFEVIGSIGGLKRLAPQAMRLQPKLIVAMVKPVSTGVDSAVLAIKRSSPLSKLIFICSVSDFISGALKSGADACLEPEMLLMRLLPTASALSARSHHRSSRS
jgi:hypothetical protein